MGKGRQYVQVEGLHIVKQIDGFHENTSTKSVHVTLVLERVYDVSADDLLRLRDAKGVERFLGSPAGVQKDIVRVPIEAGKFMLFDIGMVLLDGTPVGVLHGEHREVVCKDPVPCGPEDWKRVRKLPVYWTDRAILTQLEYTVGANNKSHYLLFWDDDRTVEYVLPCMVVFKAFYGISSQFVNAILGRTWKQAQDQLVEPQQEGRAANGQLVWPLRLARGVVANDAALRQLALFLYDVHASRCIASLHSDWLISGLRVWWNTAQIPHSTGGNGLSMSIHGHVLPRYKGRCQRFFVTRIVASGWPGPLPIIERMREEAGPADDDAEDDDEPNAGGRRSVRVDGDPDALHQTGNDPGNGNIQVFPTPPFEYTDPPKIVTTVTVGPPAPPAGQKAVKPLDPAGTVNSGEHASGESRPDCGEIEQQNGSRSEHLEGLENGLKTLVEAGVIDQYTPVGPAIGSPLYSLRNGHAAWTLAGPGTGWGGSFARQKRSQKDHPWAWVWPPHSPQLKQARALLVFHVEIGMRSGMVMDIERRPSSVGESFRLFMAAPMTRLDETAMEKLLDALRDHKGVLMPQRGSEEAFKPQDRLEKAFKPLVDSCQGSTSAQAVRVLEIKHPVAPRSDGEVGPARLNVHSLGTFLLKAFWRGVIDKEWVDRTDALLKLNS